MIYEPGDKVIKSMDDILQWLNISIKPNIPDPFKFEGRFYEELIIDKKAVSFRQVRDDAVPAASHYTRELWKKEVIKYDDRVLHIWVKA